MAVPYRSDLRSEVKTALDELSSQEDPAALLKAEDPATELLRLPENSVQIFFVSPAGKVSTFSEPCGLRIFRFDDQNGGKAPDEWTPVFIQIGGWTHPLIPGSSPALEASNGVFMFPDCYAEEPGAAVGVVLVEEVAGEEAREQLRAQLEEHTALKKEELLPKDQRLGRIGQTLVAGAGMTCRGMEYAAQKGCDLIKYVGEREKARQGEAAPQDARVGTALRYSAKGAKYATLATVKVSGFGELSLFASLKGTNALSSSLPLSTYYCSLRALL